MVLLFTLVLFTLRFTSMHMPVAAMGNIAKPGCQTECGNLTVEYPFGIGKGCFLDNSFELTCNMAYKPPKLFLKSEKFEIYNISDSEMRVANSVSSRCYNKSGNVTSDVMMWISLESSHFSFSQKNKFIAVGCDDVGMIKGKTIKGVNFGSGCLGWCDNSSNVTVGKCVGNGCCHTPIPKGLKDYDVSLVSLYNHTSVVQFNPCGYAFVGELDKFMFRGVKDLTNRSEFLTRTNSRVPIVVDWVVGGNQTCLQATECKGNSTCKDDADTGGYRCSCNGGYQGNLYLHPDCQGQFQI